MNCSWACHRVEQILGESGISYPVKCKGYGPVYNNWGTQALAQAQGSWNSIVLCSGNDIWCEMEVPAGLDKGVVPLFRTD